MLHEFLVYIINRMDDSNQTFSANHCMELLKLVAGKSNEAGLEILANESERLALLMESETSSVEHGKLWSLKLDVEQAIRGGTGQLISWREVA